MALPKSVRKTRELFADTVFWIALLRDRDQHADRALRWKKWIDAHSVPIVTTEAIMWEMLDGCAKTRLRGPAAEVFLRCQESRDVQVVPFRADRTQRAFAIYVRYADKEWSLTDCLSFVVLKERGLTEALTTDHHFQQAGFRALLLEEPPAG